MQKDLHFYATWALGVCAGYKDALLIAWADYMTDCCKGLGFHTQVSWNFAWSKAGHYFHFLPGDGENRLLTTPNCTIAQDLVNMAGFGPFALGIALHSRQDTFSHQGFMGKLSKSNSCFAWSRNWLGAILPNYGHTDMRKLPDICNAPWSDPRHEEPVNNITRAVQALNATATAYGLPKAPQSVTDGILAGDYEERKRYWAQLAGDENLRFSDIQAELWRKHKADFKMAARAQADFVRSHIN